MDKTYRDEFSRLFVIEQMPGSFSPADAHLQIYDNYVAGTRLRFRRVRVPGSRQWGHVLQQRIAAGGHTKVAEIVLDEAEYRALGAFEGNEVRKNRYFSEIDGIKIAFDVFLGPLFGLKAMKAEANSAAAIEAFEPVISGIEVTGDEFFDGSNLYRVTFAEVEARVVRNTADLNRHQTLIDELAGENE